MLQQVATLSATGAVATVRGLDENWLAPMSLYHSPTGFGEEHWVSAQSDTVIAVALTGASVVSHCAETRGRSGSPLQPLFTLQPAGTPNHYSADGEVDFGQFFLNDALLWQVGDDLGLSRPSSAMLRSDLGFVEDEQMHRWLSAYFDRSVDEADPPSRLEMEARALLITERLLRRYHMGSMPVDLAGKRAIDWRIRRSLEEIEARLADDIGLIELAAAVGLSPSHYATLFRTATGMPPHAWLVKRRVERACELLLNPHSSITDIAFALGFPSSQHFATTFRKHIGASPSEWRKARLA